MDLYWIPEEQKYKCKTKFRSWKCLISVPSHCRKDKKVLMVPNFGKSHFVEIGRPVFSAVGKLWVVSLALGTRTQRRVARSSYTTSSTTPPTHPPKFFLLRQIMCYYTPSPPKKNTFRQGAPVGLGCTTSFTTQPTWQFLWKIFKLRLPLKDLDRGIGFNFYFKASWIKLFARAFSSCQQFHCWIVSIQYLWNICSNITWTPPPSDLN